MNYGSLVHGILGEPDSPKYGKLVHRYIRIQIVTFVFIEQVHRLIEKYAVTSIVTLNCNGKYKLTPTVTVIIVATC